MTSPSEPRRAFRRWTPAELEQLRELAGNMLIQDIVEQFNKWAVANGLRPRTYRGILYAMKTNGIDCHLIGDQLTIARIMVILNVGKKRIINWVHRGWIPSKRSGAYRIIRRVHLRRLAKKRPELFSGISHERLFMLLEDEDLAKDIAKNYPRSGDQAKPIRCIETGRVFPSIAAAAQHSYVVDRAIAYAVRTGSACCGRHWEAA